MYSYIKNTLEELPEEWLSRGSGTPSSNYLFSVAPSSKKLSKKYVVFFHHNVENLLSLSKRSRTDIQPTFAFLYKRFHEPDTDDTKKLVGLMLPKGDTIFATSPRS